jgi:outer membrane protein assembly factor BamB
MSVEKYGFRYNCPMHINRLIVLSTALLISVAIAPNAHGQNWPAWRGDVAGSGQSSETNLPTQWDKKKNVRWRVALPDRGNATPVVWADRVFVPQAIEASNWRGLMCFNRTDGKLLWKNGVTYKKKEKTHRANPYCSASPVTDGKIVVVSYGSAGIACYDMDGKELWRRDFGAIEHVWGNSSSPVLHGDLVIHYHGPGKGAFLAAFDKLTGKNAWRFDEPVWKPGKRTDGFRSRDGGVIGSFSTPIIVTSGKRKELVMSFPMEIRSFDPTNGSELWRCSGLNPLVYNSPVYADGTVIAMGGYQGNSIGVKVGGSGDVTESHRLWRHERHAGGIGSGVTKDGHLYFSNSGGIVFCLEVKSGNTLWKERLPGLSKSWGSFMLAGENIYSLSQSGETVVFRANPKAFELVAHNKLDEMTNSSITPTGSQLFIRTHDALWCIEAK